MTRKIDLDVTEALIAFHDALVSLVPFADRVGIPWHDDELTDEWDAVTTSLYAAAISSVANDSENWDGPAAPLAPYDLELASFEDVSWLELSVGSGSDDRLAFLRLSSGMAPFDTAEFCRVSPELMNAGNVSLPIEEVKVALRRRLQDGQSKLESTITFEP